MPDQGPGLLRIWSFLDEWGIINFQVLVQQCLWPPDFMRVAQSPEAGVQRMQAFDASTGSGIWSARLGQMYRCTCRCMM